ncbi:tRNA preQ1(34) S-adenosylmethionine ribosyltransferase-isomerase QueA [Geomobilimonas luticola]|uniref:S-adenosylmethionine:tRNA ribosyltransferase-isomerase n=1 Tax=Geomobilimonas luticola TaxID=1114878 RepID=A0ABS5SIQ0_9BACT|nr:tRNA preQ1(34) S-adenosylmethionine ribosyltransferase-isomerase QueA [Geomobilimonas luticola]MBT0654629.1 tRNA preQ1(34) S-adenosylmethionine ribosyltransferase-isomerase QueA [Geomobilimonas luticola]
MELEEFDYHLPPELIAQVPAARRDAARLMTLERSTGKIGETVFSEVARLFRPGDLLVVNDTRVIPARLLGRKESGGRVEVFLVRRLPGDGERWHCLIRASKSPGPGTVLLLADGMTARVESRTGDDCWQVAFSPGGDFATWLERHGSMPLPPYIRRVAEEHDRERYQTVFATTKGAVAAPTAGLHMTPELLAALVAGGVEVAPITLHVGLGTFMPVRVEKLDDHRMHREEYFIPAGTAEAVARRKRDGGRVVALGTTTTRALEQAAADDGTVIAGAGEADIFIRPGYTFKVVDALITNFHLPKSTLLMLVSAFAGRDLLLESYAEAVRRKFRFFSYGDAMMIW